nr:RecName: Full=Putative movement protein [Maize rayado fino virus isolate Costa Rica]
MPLTPTPSIRPSRPTSFSMSGPTTLGVRQTSCSSSLRSSPSSSPDSPTSPTSSTTGSCPKTPPGTPPLPRTSRTARPSSCMMLSCITPQGRSLTSSSSVPSSRRSMPPLSFRLSRASRISRSIRKFTASVFRVLTLSTSRRATQPPTTRSRVRPSTGSRPPVSPLVTSSSPSPFSTLSARSIPSSSSVAALPSFRPKTLLPSAFRTPSPSPLPPPSTRTFVTGWSPARCTTRSSIMSEPSAFGLPTPPASSGLRSASLSTAGSPLPPGTTFSTSRSRPPPFVPTPRIPFSSRPSLACPTGFAPTLGRSGAWLPPRPLSLPGPLPVPSAGSSPFTPTVSGCSASTSSAGGSGLVSHSMAPSQGFFGRPIQPAARQCSLPTPPLSAKSLLVWQTGVLPPPSGRVCSPRPLRRPGSPTQPWP